MNIYLRLTLSLTIAFILNLSVLKRAHSSELYLNLFRNPSIGPELKYELFSIHSGLYSTIISKNSKEQNVSTEFIRTGISFWPADFAYVSISHLYGLNRDWRDKSGVILEAGGQILVYENRLALRFGVAVIPSSEFGTKVNPTPGLSFRFDL